ncbi:NAD-dependent epimerase/dehydratase [Pseudonocardia nematodicida]|uniref:NAD-dependent epimerase/dehydratase n=1 Tax=Pseudonocardia nematodicida TaxID=1206997 RepID=A0ABV1KEB7_9PSEU
MTARRPTVVLLGATGFVGSAVLRELARRDVTVRAVSRGTPVVPPGSRARVEPVSADLAEPGAVAGVVADGDLVIHTVAYIAGAGTWRIGDGDAAAERVNVGVVRDLVEALAHRPGPPAGVVFAGAVSQVGTPDGDVVDGGEPDRPRGGYDRQKLAAEQLLLRAHADGVLRGTSVRLPTVYGYAPDSTARDKGVVSTMVRRAVAGEPITMWHDGTVRRDLLHVSDAASALVRAGDHLDRLGGRHWVLGTGTGTPLGEAFTTVARLVGEHTGAPPVDVVTVDPPAHAESGDFRHVTVDASGFRAATGWRPAVPLDDGLAATVRFVAGDREGALR